jgi:hypothetical protein
MKALLALLILTVLTLGGLPGQGQAADGPGEQRSMQLTENGQVMSNGRMTPYLIRHLPVSSFPEVPGSIADVLSRRGCLIPQTYEAHHPENVVHASLAHAGSSDWAVLCSVEGKVSLLVFLGGVAKEQGQPMVVALAQEKDHLQAHDATGVLGFNWGVDRATPGQVRQAQAGMEKRPAEIDHDALADSVVEHRTIYHFYAKGGWTLLEMPE